MRVTDIGRSMGAAVVKGVGRLASRVQEERSLPVDVLESDEEYLVVFDAPGATASDVQVRYRNSEVVVQIDRFREFHGGFEMRYPGRALSLDGRATLPPDARVDPTAGRATLNENGTLYVHIPKRPDEGAHTGTEEESADQAASGSEEESADQAASGSEEESADQAASGSEGA